ncbi:DUF2799 domain-containing protein [Photobacterium sp. SDRW27]|uniref:DUF2799 domain-containing protein n=1 Tax=Photobacterium obscurum TaxID=2829490 RepID=UPI0022440EFB|nr:DUF2799 domain-containing protein [Photobacterium obscurum]MCW8329172.1 DUF2799 domain-containing protein [Photobacterium obscurum]
MSIIKNLREAIVRIILGTLVGYMLFGCTAFSEQSQFAQKNEWYEVGVVDGKNGHYQRSETELDEFGTLDNMAYDQYKQGYSVGVEEFCRPEKTYEYGERGIRYKGQCVSTSQGDIAIEKWQEGYDAYMLEITSVYIDEYSDFF